MIGNPAAPVPPKTDATTKTRTSLPRPAVCSAPIRSCQTSEFGCDALQGQRRAQRRPLPEPLVKLQAALLLREQGFRQGLFGWWEGLVADRSGERGRRPFLGSPAPASAWLLQAHAHERRTGEIDAARDTQCGPQRLVVRQGADRPGGVAVRAVLIEEADPGRFRSQPAGRQADESLNAFCA